MERTPTETRNCRHTTRKGFHNKWRAKRMAMDDRNKQATENPERGTLTHRIQESTTK